MAPCFPPTSWLIAPCSAFVICVLLAVSTRVAEADKASTWDYCNCRFDDWQAWSDCNSDCFGQRVRTREVWITQHDGCEVWTDCATVDEGSEYQDCNEVCYNGGVATGSSWRPCTCQSGFYQSCCTERVDCGHPGSISDGTVSVSTTYYGGKATYACNTHYNISNGDTVRLCQDNFAWSGSEPECIFVNHCGSAPCQNGATCVDLLGDFECNCAQGWGGQYCENDVQPAVMTGCSSDIYINATDGTVQHSWIAPNFSDPMGTNLDIVSNYPNPEFTFPWGDHTVQYVATKTSNGLVTECTFHIKVRPTPCVELNVPANGARMCNGWQTDYGQFCMITCQLNYTIPPSQSYNTWYVCGASGNWIAPSPAPDCEVEIESIDDAVYYQPEYASYAYSSTCQDDVTRDTLQNLYIEKLTETDGFSSFCSTYSSECINKNVEVQCPI